MLDVTRLDCVVCTTALEVQLLAALVHERRINSRRPPAKRLEAPPERYRALQLTETSTWPHPDFVGPPEMFGPPRPPRRGWRPAGAANIHDIQVAVAAAWRLTAHDLRSERRTQDVVAPRHIAVMLCTVLTAWSLPKIGRQFGGRDHTTMLHAREKYHWLEIELHNRLTMSDPLCTWVRLSHELWKAAPAQDNPVYVTERQRAKAKEYWQRRKQQEAAHDQGCTEVDADVLEGLSR